MSQVQKNRERVFFQAFIEACPDLALLDFQQTEKPDILTTNGGKPLGVEITEVYHEPTKSGANLKAGENSKWRIVKTAYELCQEAGHRQISVKINFATGFREGNKNRLTSLGQQIALVIGDNIPAEGKAVDLKQDWKEDSILPSEIRSITIMGTPGFGWMPDIAGWEPPLPYEFVQERITEKNGKIEAYQKNCGAVWLLVVVDGSMPSSWFEVDGTTITHVYTSSFDRTYLLDFSKKRTFLLKTKKLEA